MIAPLNDRYLEGLAGDIARAINAEDSALYSKLMDDSKEYRASLVRTEVFDFKNRVHFLADVFKGVKV